MYVCTNKQKMQTLFKYTLKTYKNGWYIKPQGKPWGTDTDKS